MEKDYFPPRATNREGMRDMPPVTGFPMPRMETPPGGGGGYGNGDGGCHDHDHDNRDCHDHNHDHDDRSCHCGCHDHDHDYDHDHGHSHNSGGYHDGCGCVGYEGCGTDSWGLSEYPLAMVYAPCQTFRALYDPATALQRGTLFTELDLPLGNCDGGAFVTEGCSCRAERRRV